MKKKVAFKTLGCRLNQFETDSLVTDFYKAGYEIVNFTDQADVYVINTCTVTNQSDQKSKYSINQALRNFNYGIVVVTGCMAENNREYFENRSEITYLVGNKRKSSILQLVDSHFRGEITRPDELQENIFNFSMIEKGFHTRSTIKIQDGCDNFCSYCIVPSVRGIAVSRPVKDILENISKSVDLGNKEIVLTGVNISRYKYENTSFEDLIEKIIELPGDFRLRISSIEPEKFTQKLIALFKDTRLCPHLHLCMQSGSDKVLKLMRRSYTADQYREIIEQFRYHFPDFNFTTDIIVGFPGETDKDFAETVGMARMIGFSHIHTFKYSKRKGTLAENLPGQVAEKMKNERSISIRQISDENKFAYRSKFVGKEQLVLVEGSKNMNIVKGYGEHYIPVMIKDASAAKNTFCKVRITEVLDDKEKTVLGKIILESNFKM